MNRRLKSAVVAAAVIMAGLPALSRADPWISKPTVSALVSFPSSRSERPIPNRFLGLSFETTQLCYFLHTEQKNPANLTLLRNLDLGVLRVGGTSEDFVKWEPSGKASCYYEGSVFTDTFLTRFATFSNAYHWRVIWGLNLGSNDPAPNVAEAAYLRQVLGSNLLGVEIGNEPDLYTDIPLRPKGYSVTNLLSEWRRYSRALKANVPGVQLVGPSTVGLDWFRAFVMNPSSLGLSLATEHFYPTQPGAKGLQAPTIANLLSKGLMAKTSSLLKTAVSIAAARKLQVRFDESNSVSSGGILGVSDSFAATLWAADYLLTALDDGISGIDVHEGEGENSYSPILLSTGTAQSMYYAMLFFQLITQGAVRTVPTTVVSAANVAAHAVRTKSGQLRVSILNKDLKKVVKVRVHLARAFTTAQIGLLASPSPTAATNITLAGSSVRRNGTWAPKAYRTYHVKGRTFDSTLKPASAEIVTFS